MEVSEGGGNVCAQSQSLNSHVGGRNREDGVVAETSFVQKFGRNGELSGCMDPSDACDTRQVFVRRKCQNELDGATKEEQVGRIRCGVIDALEHVLCSMDCRSNESVAGALDWHQADASHRQPERSKGIDRVQVFEEGRACGRMRLLVQRGRGRKLSFGGHGHVSRSFVVVQAVERIVVKYPFRQMKSTAAVVNDEKRYESNG
ncbi:hypothetical protein H310_07730 [Aphanomyces invadans]|uniref:Uncharacterized protein n=1 Tax=Aphanomyces invadans TaxID=157072 RepID=A0A024U209_9STRA|nr:hypothetical protein H310_07730 [Aphanomyces invadans]ETV99662.1 hypothetical protein H310_07730 [Aphanomyces invadans]|eukprot:XP_008871438.1 hypothetical protein H310_07730 [Aphanomyces invadans]